MKIKNIMLLICAFSCMSLLDDVFNIYFEDVSETLSVILHFIQIIVLFVFCKHNSFCLKEMVKKPIKSYLMVSFIMGILIMTCCDVIELKNIFPQLSPKYNTEETYSIFYLVYFCIYAGLIAPIAEEIEFRGLLFRGLYNSGFKLISSLILSSFMFLIIHTGNINTGAFVLGIVSGIMYYLTGNLLYSMVLHFSGNIIVCFISFLSIFINNTDQYSFDAEGMFLLADQIITGIFVITIVTTLLFYIYISSKKENKKTSNLIKQNLKEINNDTYSIKKIGIYILIYTLICFLATIIQYQIAI